MAFPDPEQSLFWSHLQLGRCQTPSTKVSKTLHDQCLWKLRQLNLPGLQKTSPIFPAELLHYREKLFASHPSCVCCSPGVLWEFLPQLCRGLGAKGLSSSYLRTRGLPLVWGHNQIRHDKEDAFTLE